jgi:hypothetical protein
VIKAEINQAKNTFDLVRMADAIVRLDALQLKWKRPPSQQGCHVGIRLRSGWRCWRYLRKHFQVRVLAAEL